MSKSLYPIFSNSIIIVSTQSYLVYRLREDLVVMCYDYIRFPHLHVSAK